MTRDELQAFLDAEFAAEAKRFGDRLWAQLNPTTVAPPSTGPCIDAAGMAAFFDAVRKGPPLGPGLQPGEVEGCETLINAAGERRFPVSWVAYLLATTYHETAATMQPIREIGRGQGRPYGVPGKHNGQIAYGRGYVQLTWDTNYERADKELGLNGALLANYDLAMDHGIAARILVLGMENAWFTGKGLRDYLPAIADIHQFTNARRIVNGLDRATEIAAYALTFQEALKPVWRC